MPRGQSKATTVLLLGTPREQAKDPYEWTVFPVLRPHEEEDIGIATGTYPETETLDFLIVSRRSGIRTKEEPEEVRFVKKIPALRFFSPRNFGHVIAHHARLQIRPPAALRSLVVGSSTSSRAPRNESRETTTLPAGRGRDSK
ncbi:uncharacterized protein LOC143211298 [Lasioglossum baleicum]|uniref:uncharacterized protein LOC143211298 n=1 Tax=Lasioglossum baleicum TaxID=434251 RepID=UPI003FCD3C02